MSHLLSDEFNLSTFFCFAWFNVVIIDLVEILSKVLCFDRGVDVRSSSDSVMEDSSLYGMTLVSLNVVQHFGVPNADGGVTEWSTPIIVFFCQNASS